MRARGFSLGTSLAAVFLILLLAIGVGLSYVRPSVEPPDRPVGEKEEYAVRLDSGFESETAERRRSVVELVRALRSARFRSDSEAAEILIEKLKACPSDEFGMLVALFAAEVVNPGSPDVLLDLMQAVKSALPDRDKATLDVLRTTASSIALPPSSDPEYRRRLPWRVERYFEAVAHRVGNEPDRLTTWEALLDERSESQGFCRREFMHCLGYKKAVQFAPILRGIVTDVKVEPLPDRLAAAKALARMGQAEDLWGIVQHTLRSDDLDEQRQLLMALARFPDEVLAYAAMREVVQANPRLDESSMLGPLIAMRDLNRNRISQILTFYARQASIEGNSSLAGHLLQAIGAEPTWQVVESPHAEAIRAELMRILLQRKTASREDLWRSATAGSAWTKLARDPDELLETLEEVLELDEARAQGIVANLGRILDHIPGPERREAYRVRAGERLVRLIRETKNVELKEASIRGCQQLRYLEATPVLLELRRTASPMGLIRRSADRVLKDFAEAVAGRRR